MNDMRAVIVPKSDQINADDLLAGPITITITEVTIRPGTEQPVSVHFEGDNGKPFKPCKSMCRAMVHCWGADANQYAGRSMTLYCDPKIKWGGMAVGGIRISHMSHLNSAVTMALTETKGKKQPFVVQPLKEAPPVEPERPTRPTDAEMLDRIVTALECAKDAAGVKRILTHHEAQHLRDRLGDEMRFAYDAAAKAAEARFEPPPAEPAAELDDPFPSPEQIRADREKWGAVDA